MDTPADHPGEGAPAAAWHPDPTGRHESRFWDGAAWTDDVADGGVVGTDPVDPVAAGTGPGTGESTAAEPVPGPAPDAAWYPDPVGRHEQRWYDGTQWTEHVLTHGNRRIDPLGAAPPAGVPAGSQTPQQVSAQVREKAGVVTAAAGGGTLFTEPVLVVNQKMKVIEVNTEYAVFDQHGTQLAAVRQVGQSSARKALRVLSNVDQFLTHSLQVVDPTGAVLLTVTRPAKFVKSRLEVGDARGDPVGQVVQQNAIGKIRFSLEADGHTYGAISAENWRAWNFSITDHTGSEVARITKTWEGLGKTMFTTADNYVLQIHQPLADPLLSLVVGSALCVDTALKQDNRGLS